MQNVPFHPLNPYPQPPPRRQRVFDAGAMSAGDWWTVVAYVLLFVIGGAVVFRSIPGFDRAFPTEEAAQFGMNLILYSVFFVLAMLNCGAQFFESFKTMRYRPVLKWLMLPGGWLITIIASAFIAALSGGPQTSENQLALESMTAAVPFLVMFVMSGLFGPFVEEYIFRHLLIGKLARRLNVWVCAAISTVLFAGIHFLSAAGAPSLIEVLPYLLLGVMMSCAYILTGRSMAYSYMLHVANNAVALIVAYSAPLEQLT